MRRVVLSSTKSGQEAAGRRVLASQSTTNAAPSDAGAGVLLQGSRGFWVEVELGGTGPEFEVDFWAYSYTAMRWFPTESSGYFFDSSLRVYVPFEGGPCRIYPRVTSVSGTLPTMNMWIVEAIDEP